MKFTKFDKQLFRRFIASIIDIVIVLNISLLMFLVIWIINFFILGLFNTAYYFIIPVIFSSYYMLTLGGKKQSTIGMNYMEFKLSLKKNEIFTEKLAFLHSLSFFLILPLGIITLTYFIYPLLNDKRSCLHDIVYKVRFIDLGENS